MCSVCIFATCTLLLVLTLGSFMNLHCLIEKFDVYVLSSFLCSSVVQVKFSQSLVATTEEEGRVLVTVEAMGDLSSDFSIIVMAINGTAVGKLLRQSMSVQTHDLTVDYSRPPNQLNVNFLRFVLLRAL